MNEDSCRIKMFFHCRACIEEMPADQSPKQWERISVGCTENTLQVWCTRHQKTVTEIPFGEVEPE